MSGKKSTTGITRSTITQRVKAAAGAGRIIITTHAATRALARGITTRQMIEVAKSGTQIRTEPPEKEGLNPITRMTKRVAGDDVTIIATVEERRNGESVVIITGWA